MHGDVPLCNLRSRAKITLQQHDSRPTKYEYVFNTNAPRPQPQEKEKRSSEVGQESSKHGEGTASGRKEEYNRCERQRKGE